MRNRDNPFAQPARLWQASVIVPAAAAAAFEAALSQEALSSSLFEAEESGERWRIDLIYGAPPEEAGLKRHVAALAAAQGIGPPEVEIAELPALNWLAEVAASHPPLAIGRYFVHGSHHADGIPPASVALEVDAGLAFGSGEHATTAGCLRMLGETAKKRRYGRVLDVGCGSGILALAAAKTFPDAQVLAVDLDPVCVRVTRENARKNRVRLSAAVSNGYEAPVVTHNGPYDLILANILARPLVAFAKDLARHLAPGGAAILSGLLARQEPWVLAAHRAQGLYLRARWRQGGWSVLVLG